MLKLFQSLFGQFDKKSNSYDDELIDRAIERVVDGTDSRLHAVFGYRKRLRPAVTKAVDYTFELVDRLPAPIELSRNQFSQDDRIRSFFASPDHINEFLTQSTELQSYLERRSGRAPENIHALLALTRSEKNVLGATMDGEVTTREVAQVSIVFGDPRLSDPMDEEHASRFETKKAVFNNFVELALKKLIDVRSEQQKEKQQRTILTRKLHTLKSSNWGIESVLGEKSEKPVNTDHAEDEIRRIEAELKTLKTTPDTLDDHLILIAESLSAVREQLWKTSTTVKLDRMGIKVEKESDDTAITLQLDEYCSSDGRKVIALPVYVPLNDIPVRPDLLEEARRYL